MKTLVAIGLAIAAVALASAVWLCRFYTNTASGRFFKNDRWTWKTLVVERNVLIGSDDRGWKRCINSPAGEGQDLI